jgi:hypothetical protein
MGRSCKKHTDEEQDKVVSRLKDLEMKMNKKMGEFENLIRETEKKTLWKISECESLLSKKITVEYVDRALVQLEQKMQN